MPGVRPRAPRASSCRCRWPTYRQDAWQSPRQELEVELSRLGVEHEVVAAFLETLRESKDSLPPGLTDEIAGLLSSGTLNATVLVDLVSRLAGDNTA